MTRNELMDALVAVFISGNVTDSQGEAANLVDTTQRIGSALWAIAKALERIAGEMEDRP